VIVVERVVTERFMGHQAVDVDLPPTGIVVITGANGSGKSTLIEAVGAGLWAKLLRGTKWLPSDEAAVSLRASCVSVKRTRKGRQRKLVWSPSGSEEEPTEYGTESKAQEALESLVGTFDQWRRSSVFSSADLDTFTRATDAERKRLLETMIGVDVFDGALLACRRDLRGTQMRSVELAGKLRELQAKLEGWRRQDEEAKEGAGPEPPRPDSSLCAAKDQEHTRVQREYSDLVRRETTAENEQAQADRRIRRAQAELDNLDQMETCSKCGQELSDEARERLGAGARETIEEAERTLQAAKTAMSEVGGQVDVAEASLKELRAELEDLRAQSAAYDQWVLRRGLREERRERIADELRKLDRELLDLEDEIDEAGVDVAELEVVERVLGLQGVRAHIVARTLAGVENIANVWVERLLPGASVSLSPDTELKRGGTVERISLEVAGVGHDDGYMGCSGGERRRLDVALLLALAEVQAGAAGGAPGTLWLDEVFDTLDTSGKAAVSAALGDVAQERCVVVITHSDELAASLESTRRIVFKSGRVSDVR
jgi:DNA repair exonuclease SbcCD ATPase subunit